LDVSMWPLPGIHDSHGTSAKPEPIGVAPRRADTPTGISHANRVSYHASNNTPIRIDNFRRSFHEAP